MKPKRRPSRVQPAVPPATEEPPSVAEISAPGSGAADGGQGVEVAPRAAPAGSGRGSELKATTFEGTLGEELDAIHPSRRARGRGDRPFVGATPVERAHDARLLGLAFSGGGIRSATFNLGVATGLARLGLLRAFDYLSVNSGGGYIGGWLLAWIRRAGLAEVERQLAAARCPAPPGSHTSACADPPPVSFLRRFSNYLTPKVGVFTADTWTLVATYLRNLILNQGILILALAALLLTPRLVVIGAAWVTQMGDPSPIFVVALVGLGLAVTMVGLNLMSSNERITGHAARFASQGAVQLLVVVPLFLSAWLAGLWLWLVMTRPDDSELRLSHWLASQWGWYAEELHAGGKSEPWIWAAIGAGVYGAVWVVGVLLLALQAWLHKNAGADRFRLWATILLSAPLAGAIGGLLLWLLSWIADTSGDALEASTREAPWHLFHVNVWQAPAIVLVFVLTAVVHTGLMGRIFRESYRQWWSRLAAWLMIYGISWIGLFGMAIYGPIVLLWAGSALASSLAAGWGVSTITGVLVGKRQPDDNEKPSLWRRLVVAATPQIFIVGMLGLVALGLHAVLRPPEPVPSCDYFWPAEGTSFGDVLECHSAQMWAATLPQWRTSLLFAALVLGSLILSWRVDINQFSMHLFYRNRLIRAFLGASNAERRPQPFTGFDLKDDLPLSELDVRRGYDGPYPILNVALNLVGGDELAWQERKAASFTFGPLRSGFEVHDGDGTARNRRLNGEGFRPTAGYDQTAGGLTLGTAMGISGAAVSPNMGAQSTAAMAFLLTMFNVRLGWWLGNPRRDATWSLMGPRVGLASLLSELLGHTNEQARYVYLSDGGHFDNLGLYELVRRRCRFIVLTDAGADPEMTFEDLAGAMRKCRTDFGVEIELDVRQLKLDAAGSLSPWHCAVGKICYDRVDEGATPGFLVYLKASLTGDEPEDVQNYAADHPLFPHESTADQWFGEAQFESYRKLGEHIVTTALQAAHDCPSSLSPERLFVELQRTWHPRSAGTALFSGHSRTLDGLLERLRTDPKLSFMTTQLYPEWSKLTATFEGDEAAESDEPQGAGMPQRSEELHNGLYLCSSLLQLAENVYLDLNLEDEFDHPDNRGWMNLFRFWSTSTLFRLTWTLNAGTFGSRFQAFSERRLGLRLNDVHVEEVRGVEELPRKCLTEREAQIIDDIVAEHPGEVDRIFLFELDRQDLRRERKGAQPSFVFGFALGSGRELVYFRIQDHLRKIGLARKALEAMIRQCGVTRRREVKIPASVLALPGEGEIRAFDRLLDSVRNEIDNELKT